MPQSEPQGCLTAILRLFGIQLGRRSPSPAAAERLPYQCRDDFLSAAERSFYGVLRMAVREQLVVFAKVRLGDIFHVVGPNGNQGHRNKIDRKHVDFLLCDPATIGPLLGIELDDKSHSRPDRIERDRHVDSVFAAASLPLLHVQAQASYDPAGLAAMIQSRLAGSPAAMKPPPPSPLPAIRPAGPPACPKCGVAMVKRTATKGANAGRAFFGCPNYPRCKEIVQAG